MTTAVYTRFELVRTFRNKRFFLFTLGFPLILFLLAAGPNQHQKLEGVPFPLYYMAGMVAWGTMGAVMGGGARIALERQIGWTRQLRITPITPAAYFRGKVLGSYAMAAITIALLYLAGSAYGVTLPAGRWLAMTGLVLLGLIPFTLLGVAAGHLLSPDAMGPALGGSTALLALISGAFSGPLFKGGVLLAVTKLQPAYWLVQAGKAATRGGGWPLEGWLVVGFWSVALAGLALGVYRRDSGRV